MEVCYLYHFIKKVRSFYDNGGGYAIQSNYTVWDFHLHLSDTKLQNAATNTSRIYILLARMLEKKIIRGGTLWDQTDGCANQYGYSIVYYLMFFYQNQLKLLFI